MENKKVEFYQRHKKLNQYNGTITIYCEIKELIKANLYDDNIQEELVEMSENVIDVEIYDYHYPELFSTVILEKINYGYFDFEFEQNEDKKEAVENKYRDELFQQLPKILCDTPSLHHITIRDDLIILGV